VKRDYGEIMCIRRGRGVLSSDVDGVSRKERSILYRFLDLVWFRFKFRSITRVFASRILAEFNLPVCVLFTIVVCVCQQFDDKHAAFCSRSDI